MYKKLTFLFVTTFVIALAFFSSYFVIQEVRGGVVNIGSILDMNGHSISSLGFPTDADDLVTRGYLKDVGDLFTAVGHIDSWCDVQYFDWCSGAPDPVPPPPEGCSGAPYLCSHWGELECEMHDMCFWDYGKSKCSGAPLPCSDYPTQSECEDEGCDWN